MAKEGTIITVCCECCKAHSIPDIYKDKMIKCPGCGQEFIAEEFSIQTQTKICKSEKVVKSSKNKAMRKCRHCSKEVSKDAKACPYCGLTNPSPFGVFRDLSEALDRLAIGIVIFLLFLYLIGKISGLGL